MPNFNRFTIRAQEALQNAQDLASRENQGELRPLHLLSALISDSQSLVQPTVSSIFPTSLCRFWIRRPKSRCIKRMNLYPASIFSWPCSKSQLLLRDSWSV